MEVLQVFVYYQTNEKVAAGGLLLFWRQAVKGLRQNLVRRPIPNLMDDVLLGAGDGPGITNRGATLRSHACKPHLATH